MKSLFLIPSKEDYVTEYEYYLQKTIVVSAVNNHKGARYRYFIRLAFGLCLIAFLCWRVDLHPVLNSLCQVSLLEGIEVMSLVTVAMIFTTLKWRILINIPFTKLFAFNLIGQYYNMVLPGQASGDLMKGFLICKNEEQKEHVFVSIFTDKLTSMIGFLPVGLYGAFGQGQYHFAMPLIYTSLFVISVFFSIRFISEKHLKSVLDWIQHKLSFLTNLRNVSDKLLSVWRDYSCSPWIMTGSIISGAIFQFFAAGVYYLIAQSIDLNLSFSQSCLIMGVTTLLCYLPVSVAGIGIREASLLGMLSLNGVSEEVALSYSFAILGQQLLTGVPGFFLDLIRKPKPSLSKT